MGEMLSMAGPRILVLCVLLFPALATGCAATDEAEAPGPSLVPSSGSVHGNFEILADLRDTGLAAADITGVTVGGVRAWGLAERDQKLAFMVQGHATGGEVDVVVSAGETSATLGKPFTYTAPSDARFARVYAFGASISQGTQRGVPNQRSQLISPVALVARQLGAWFPLPLLVEPLFPGIKPADIGPAPRCQVPDIVSHVSKESAAVMVSLKDLETNKLTYAAARIDPDLAPQNLAVGGSKVRTVLDGPDADDVGGNFVAHLVYDPYGTFLGPVHQSQLELLESAKPSLIMSVDLYGNDLIRAIVGETELKADGATSLKNLTERLDLLVPRLAATGAEVFIANLPRPTLIPVTAELKGRRLAAAPAAERAALQKTIDTEIAALDKLTTDANAALAKVAAAHDNVHVVDLASRVADLEKTGLTAGDQTLTVAKFGGLLGLDGVHFSDTGNAMTANAVIETINSALGTDVPTIDLAEMVATDPDSPANLIAAGLDITACEGVRH